MSLFKLGSILLLSYIYFVSGNYIDEVKTSLVEKGQTCAKELNLNIDTIMENVRGKQLPEEYNCWSKCWSQKFGVMKEDGSFDSEFFDDFTNKMPSEDKEALNKLKCECEKTVKANSDCTPGNQIFQCLNGVPHFEFFSS